MNFTPPRSAEIAPFTARRTIWRLPVMVQLARTGWPGSAVGNAARDGRRKVLIWLALTQGRFPRADVARAFQVSEDYLQHCTTLGGRVFAKVDATAAPDEHAALSALEAKLTAFLSADPQPAVPARRSRDPAAPRAAGRRCLYCRRRFESCGPNNRICARCATAPERQAADSNPFLGQFK
ncbi:MAG: hypothetical protein AB7G15_17395 [Alphaproteobacteria bacterium]